MRGNIKDLIIIPVILILVIILGFVTHNNNKKETVNMTVAVHIKGEVKVPGYYEFTYGSKVKDAVEKAGGATEKANLDGVNLAAKLRDGDEIIIPAKGEVIVTDEVVSAETTVNINTADINALCTLQGIGISTAESIISYRKTHGDFNKIEDLKKVEGIGESKFENIKNKITV